MIRPLLTADAIDVAGEVARLRTYAGTGAVVTFEGLTRADVINGREVVSLDYEAHEPVATQQMRELADDAGQRWPLLGVTIVHRTGMVAVGEPSVLIAVAAPHRADAFAACQWLIDTLKSTVAIWKREVLDDGSGRWINTPDLSDRAAVR